jgi:hypothetical protein
LWLVGQDELERFLGQVAAGDEPLELLCQRQAGWLAPQGLIDAVGDAPLQAPERVTLGSPLGKFALIVGAAFRISGDLRQGDEVQDSVELAVPAAVDSLESRSSIPIG